MSFVYGTTVNEIKRRLSSPEVTALLAAYRLGLLPDPQHQTAQLCAVLANLHRDKDTKPFKAEDFLWPSSVNSPR